MFFVLLPNFVKSFKDKAIERLSSASCLNMVSCAVLKISLDRIKFSPLLLISKSKQEPKAINLCSVLWYTIWILKQFANVKEINRMQKKRMLNKRMQIKPTLNV